MKELIGSRLKEVRKARGLSVEDVSWDVDYSANFIWQVERGSSMANIELVARLAERYEISLDLLVYGSEVEFNRFIAEILNKAA